LTIYLEFAVFQGCGGNFTGAGALLGIFAYKQWPIIHWWRWRGGASEHYTTAVL